MSEYTAGLVRGLGVPAARVVRTPPAIDPGPFVDGREDDLREALGLVGRRVLLTHGRLDPRKGHDVVIRALGRVARAVPEVSYLITGTGPTEGALRRLAAEEGVEERVRFGGRIPQERLPALYRTCDLFLMPSRRIGWNVEGFGIVALEAGAAGRAVVAGRSGGTGDAVVDGETGCLVDPEDPAALAERLIALLGDPAALREMGAAGRARVTTSFDLRAHARRLDELDRVARASAPRG